MEAAAAVAAVLRNDARRMLRDRFLLSASLYMLGSAAALRWILPWIDRVVASRWGLDLVPYHPLIVSYFAAVLSALAVGLVGGLLLLESREDGSVVALALSPLPLDAYVATASAILSIVAAGLILLESLLIGLGLPSWGPLLATAVVGGLFAPLVALYVASFASNKLEAFALLKLLGLIGAVPLAAYFLPTPWQYLGGLVPPYWALKAWWVAEAGGRAWSLWLAGGALTSGALVAYLVRRVGREATRPAGG
jgi:fluoroquinolone transport system permease protein